MKEELDNIYEVNFECQNCKMDTIYDIPRGVKVFEFIIGKKCRNCGCKVLDN